MSQHLLIILVFLAFFWQILVPGWARNDAALLANLGLHSNDPGLLNNAEQTLASFKDACWGSWLLGSVYDFLGKLDFRDQAWEKTLSCSPLYIQLIQAVDPANISLAKLAVKEYPGQAEAWFWLAELELRDSPEQAIHAYWQVIQLQPDNDRAWRELSRILASLDPQVALATYERLGFERIFFSDPLLQPEILFIKAQILAKSQPERAVQLYRQGLQNKPYDGVRWYELGDLLAKTDPVAALEAYLQSCKYGDPGNHGCYNAGLIVEKQGDFPLAIRYYRLSKWEKSLKRAAELEQNLP